MDPSPSEEHILENAPLLEEEDKNEQKKDAVPTLVNMEVGKGILFKLRLSAWYLAYCLLSAVVSLALMLYLIISVNVHKQKLQLWVVALDGVITVVILVEVLWDMAIMKKTFWAGTWHIFDFVVTLLSVVGWMLSLVEYVGLIADLEELAVAALLAVRYMAQTTRIVRCIHQAKEAKKAQEVDEEIINLINVETNY